MPPEPDFEHVRQAVRERLAQNLRLRRNLPGGGRLRIDRQLPFLCVYRQPEDRDDAGTAELVTTEAAYLFAPSGAEHREGLSRLCRTIAETVQEHFGVLLLLEFWSLEEAGPRGGAAVPRPAFRIVAPEEAELPSTVDAFRQALARISIEGHAAEVELVTCSTVAPPGMPSLTAAWRPELAEGQSAAGQSAEVAAALRIDHAETLAGCFHLGLAIRPIYRDAGGSGAVYPVILQQLRRQLSRALRRAIFAFTGMKASRPGLHFDSLGPSSLVKAARLVDLQLCEISESFDFLLQATPVNAEPAWQAFAASGYREEPMLRYRPLPYHPSLIKRRLYEIPVERMEDPTLAHLFWQKQTELDRQISALRDLGTANFLPGSVQLYGKPDAKLVLLAEQVLAQGDSPAECEDAHDEQDGCVNAEQMAERAREEIDFYHARQASFSARVEICNHIAAGLMVAGDRLYVAETFRTSARRAESLLHHEVGTHLLTYFNGREQPFRQLFAGLADYETLQEGLAMLAEYCTGGLTRKRMRTIAARVVAVASLLEGRSFTETFARLHHDYQFSARAAFITTLRAYRGGGLTKDVIYLRGLREVLQYLAEGHELEPLYVGKIALDHVPFVQELRRRNIIKPAALLPRYWEWPDFRARLEECRRACVLDLIQNSTLARAARQPG